jgi:hypothetical protein
VVEDPHRFAALRASQRKAFVDSHQQQSPAAGGRTAEIGLGRRFAGLSRGLRLHRRLRCRRQTHRMARLLRQLQRRVVQATEALLAQRRPRAGAGQLLDAVAVQPAQAAPAYLRLHGCEV